jgi:hypothetical protein
MRGLEGGNDRDDEAEGTVGRLTALATDRRYGGVVEGNDAVAPHALEVPGGHGVDEEVDVPLLVGGWYLEVVTEGSGPVVELELAQERRLSRGQLGVMVG